MAVPNSAAEFDSARRPWRRSGAVIVSEAAGPYDAQLIEADSGSKLFEWLNEQGYYQDPKSEPPRRVCRQGLQVPGIKLQNGQTRATSSPSR